MPQYKVTYFNLKGLGEGIRYMLSYMGKEFQDNRLEMKDWQSAKQGTPFGKLPTLEIDGKVFHQSNAILRYLAVEAGLSGKTPCENLEIDQVAGAVMDLVAEVGRMWRLEGKAKDDYKQTLINETVPFYFGKFDKILKENNGFLANGKLSWADILLVSYSETMTGFLGITDLHQKFPHFKALFEKVQSLPGIKEWIQRRPASAL